MAVTAGAGVIRAAPDRVVAARRIDWSGYLFVGFFTVPFLLFNITPIFFGIYLAFNEWGIVGAPTWVGLANFKEALADDWVANAFLNTLCYALLIVPGVTVLGLTFALFVHQRWPLATLARTLFFTPNVVSATVIGLVWVWLLDTQFGLVNQYLALVGIGPVPWLTSGRWALIGVSIASI
jgi:multiple sugar transport system permease protein